jgi:hypothetical protein
MSSAGDKRLIAAKLAAAHDRASTIDPVNLKYPLGDIQTNCGNLLHGRLALLWLLTAELYGTSMPGAKAFHIRSIDSRRFDSVRWGIRERGEAVSPQLVVDNCANLRLVAEGGSGQQLD